MHEPQPQPETPAPRPGLTWRDPVLWLVIGPPLGAVLGGLATVWIAASHRDPLVSDSVQKVGVSWQEPAPAPAPAAAGATSVPAASAPASAAPAADEASDGDGG